MNSRTRCIEVLNGRKSDRIPFFPLLMFFAADRGKMNFSTFCTDANALADAQINLFENYHVDAVTVSTDPYRISADLGAGIEYPADHIPIVRKPLLRTEEDLHRLVFPDPMKRGSRMRNRIDAVEKLKREIGDRALICGWVEMPFAEVCDWFGVENTMLMLMDEPELLEEALNIAADMEIQFAEAQIAAGADMIGCGDAVASLISRSAYQKYALPAEQKVIAGIRERNAYSKLHICGDTTRSLPLLAQSGADLVCIDSKVEFDYAVEVFGKAGIPFKGNLDPVRDLLNATPEAVREKSKELIAKAENCAYMLSPGCEIPAAVSDEVYFALADAVK